MHLWNSSIKAGHRCCHRLYRVGAGSRSLVIAVDMTQSTIAIYDNCSSDLLCELESTTMNDVYEFNVNTTFADVFMEQLALTLNVFYSPLLIILGSFGNIISIIVFYKSKLRVQSTSQYLSALAFSDTLFLCQLIPPWLKAVDASTVFAQNGYCQLFVYLSYVTSNFSSWLVVAFTLERFVAVVYPLRRNAMCTVKRARLIIFSLAVSALLVNLPVLWFAVSSGNDCNINMLLLTPAARFNVVDTVVSFTLPMAIIVVMNSWIMKGKYRMEQREDNMLEQPPATLGREALILSQQPRLNNGNRSQQRITRMLLIVSSVFVLLNVPAYSMRIAAYAYNMGEREYSGKWAAAQQICLLFFNTNFGINFLLYCLTGQNFRRALLETFPWLRRRRLVLVALREYNTDRPARASSVSTSFAHSFSNNYTEASNYGASTSGTSGTRAAQASGSRDEYLNQPSGSGLERVTVPATPRRGRRPEQQVIQRWRFDNSRQRRGDGHEQQQPGRVDDDAEAGRVSAGNFSRWEGEVRVERGLRPDPRGSPHPNRSRAVMHWAPPPTPAPERRADHLVLYKNDPEDV